MITVIESPHFDVDNKLKTLILDKTNALTKLFERIESCKVILELKKDERTQNKLVEVTLNVPQNKLFAKDQAQTFELALDLVVNELKIQLKKYKEKKAEFAQNFPE